MEGPVVIEGQVGEEANQVVQDECDQARDQSDDGRRQRYEAQPVSRCCWLQRHDARPSVSISQINFSSSLCDLGGSLNDELRFKGIASAVFRTPAHKRFAAGPSRAPVTPPPAPPAARATVRVRSRVARQCGAAPAGSAACLLATSRARAPDAGLV